MIWGAIWLGGRSRVVLMERDHHSPRQGYSAALYVEIIREELPTCYETGMLFMQDNAPIHLEKRFDSVSRAIPNDLAVAAIFGPCTWGQADFCVRLCTEIPTGCAS